MYLDFASQHHFIVPRFGAVESRHARPSRGLRRRRRGHRRPGCFGTGVRSHNRGPGPGRATGGGWRAPSPGEVAPTAPAPSKGNLDTESIFSRLPPSDFAISGFLQLQYVSSQLSTDQVQQGGALLNQNRFLARRARLHVERGFEYVAGLVNLEANNLRGPNVSLRRAEGTVFYRQPQAPHAPPLLSFTLGYFDVPFGYELVESARSRALMERTRASLALFPSEADYGAKLSAAAGPFRATLALVNGDSGDTRFAIDPSAAKDFVGRFGFDAEPSSRFRLSFGTSFLTGRGFHPGSDATKSSLTWRDVNENGVVDTGEVTGIAGVAATPSQTFRHWALGADLEVRATTGIGSTVLQAEVYVASNLDRGFLIADPVVSQLDVREVGYAASLLQEIGRYGFVGFRTDLYDPNADFMIKRRGAFLPSTARVRTYSPLVGLGIPGQGRLLFQYDIVDDRLGTDARGVPADIANNQWTLRLQVSL